VSLFSRWSEKLSYFLIISIFSYEVKENLFFKKSKKKIVEKTKKLPEKERNSNKPDDTSLEVKVI